ncbi:hypothetical protein BS50DRAFT_624158 [Corynespora cassiicola Philippines]|uniref:DUF6594 domain-containing protein n=1 Tax=Corynespora cassiicola Philippines TaxID=1448308 RepID=A0A2T2NDV5_CORCC|nr:hypothetical protein BS50DRAFT_624158 [Corynespora cassiicola Philippines]
MAGHSAYEMTPLGISVRDHNVQNERHEAGRPVSNLGDNKERHETGYPQLSYFFARYPRYLHLRRFAGLASRTLLRRQYKLIGLEERLLDFENSHGLGLAYKEMYPRDGEQHQAVPDENREIILKRYSELHGEIEENLREYEEALIRFDKLGSKIYDSCEIDAIQRFRESTKGCDGRMEGAADSAVWGSITNTRSHASDLIEVVHRPQQSIVVKFIIDRGIKWVNQMRWRKRSDALGYSSFSIPFCEAITLAVGNIAVSALVYFTVTLLLFYDSKARGIIIFIVIATMLTCFGVLFKNEQFLLVLAAVSAVFVSLLVKDAD